MKKSPQTITTRQIDGVTLTVKRMPSREKIKEAVQARKEKTSKGAK